MARTPLGEIVSNVADGLGSAIRVRAAVNADGAVYAMAMQGIVQSTVEAHLNALVAQSGGKLRRSMFSPGSVGATGAALYNMRWRTSGGKQPGFTVVMRHERKNVRVINLVGRATYPLAMLVGLALGLLFEYFWYPWMGGFFSSLFRGNPLGSLYILAILVSTAIFYWLFVKTTNVVYIGLYVPAGCAVASVALSFFWGGIAGAMIGWWLVTWAMNGSSGHQRREELARTLQAASAAITSMPPPVFAPAAPFMAPAYGGPPAYGAPPPRGAPHAGYVPPPPAYGQPAAPMYAQPARAPAYGAPAPPGAMYDAPAARPPTYPCHSCGKPVPEMAASCPSCGTGIVWS